MTVVKIMMADVPCDLSFLTDPLRDGYVDTSLLDKDVIP